MKKLARTLTRVAKKLKERYEFLADTDIQIVEGYGIAGATAYNPRQRCIYVDLLALKATYQTPRFTKRFGRSPSFEHHVLKVLLHESHHVWQDANTPPNRLYAALNEIERFDEKSHDESWIELEADKWSRKEYPKVKHLLAEVGL